MRDVHEPAPRHRHFSGESATSVQKDEDGTIVEQMKKVQGTFPAAFFVKLQLSMSVADGGGGARRHHRRAGR